MILDISECGGLFGLFLGLSFTTIINFIQEKFIAFQAWKNKVQTVEFKKVEKKEAWSNTENLEKHSTLIDRNMHLTELEFHHRNYND